MAKNNSSKPKTVQPMNIKISGYIFEKTQTVTITNKADMDKLCEFLVNRILEA